VADGFEIVATGLLDTLVRVDGSITSGSRQVLAVLVGNVLALGVLEALGETKVDNVDVIFGLLGAADQKVVRLDISVDNAFLVHFLNAFQHLDGNVQNSFEVELAFAGLEKILEGGAQKVHHHHVELLVGHGVVGADVVEPGDASFSS